jgi:hypothetical protein
MDLTRVSVVLPTLNEAAALPAALASFPAQADLVVVDSGSTDATTRRLPPTQTPRRPCAARLQSRARPVRRYRGEEHQFHDDRRRLPAGDAEALVQEPDVRAVRVWTAGRPPRRGEPRRRVAATPAATGCAARMLASGSPPRNSATDGRLGTQPTGAR